MEDKLSDFQKLLLGKDSKQRQYYESEKHSDELLKRFLKARPNSLNDAVIMFNNREEWLIKENIADLVHMRFPNAHLVQEIYPRFFHHTDKFGRPIWIKRHFNLDLDKIKQVAGKDDWENTFKLYHVRENEKLWHYRLPACSAAKGKHVGQVLLIMDIGGISLSQIPKGYSILKTVAAIDADFYPEMLGNIIVINAGVLFAGFWAVIKSFLPAETVAKVSIVGSNYQDELAKHCDLEKLPHFLGGECNCPEGCENVDVGPWNNGDVPGYPIAMYEDLAKLDREASPHFEE